MAEDRSGVDGSVRAVLDCDHEEIYRSDALVQDAAGIGDKIAGQICMDVGHDKICGICAVVALETNFALGFRKV